MHAARNIKLCTKDCLCLFVCPTGATDTENGQIDFAKCIDGCRLCVDACPSHAIHLVYDRYPEKPGKDEDVVAALGILAQSKAEQEAVCESLVKAGGQKALLAKGLALSNRILAEDATREANHMVPQDTHSKSLLKQLLEETDDVGFPKQIVEKLLDLL